MLIGIVLSIALHGAAFYGRGVCIYAPPRPVLEQGRTVVHLTLVPSMASQTAEPEPHRPEPSEPEPQVEQAILPAVPEQESTQEASAEADTQSINAQEQEASPEENKGVTAEASLVGAFRPPYPRISQRRGETGTVTLSIQVLADGTVGEVAVRHSSGYRRLDEAAVKAAQKCTFTPAVRLGRNIDSHTELPYTFTLTDD